MAERLTKPRFLLLVDCEWHAYRSATEARGVEAQAIVWLCYPTSAEYEEVAPCCANPQRRRYLLQVLEDVTSSQPRPELMMGAWIE